MNYILIIPHSVSKAIAGYKKSNPLVGKKILNILEELKINPRIGTGHPEPLKGGGDITWSRKLNKKDRIIYDIHDDIVTIYVVQVGGHYDDK